MQPDGYRGYLCEKEVAWAHLGDEIKDSMLYFVDNKIIFIDGKA